MPGGENVDLGELIRRQREQLQLSQRRLADLAGISNPYLSQIERGLREPSEAVVQALAEQLELNAQALRAHLHEEPPSDAVRLAIRDDTTLSEAQRAALLELYGAFIAVNRARRR